MIDRLTVLALLAGGDTDSAPVDDVHAMSVGGRVLVAVLTALTLLFLARAVVLGHGDADSRAWFAEQIHARHPRIKVHQPGPGQTIEA